MPRKTTPARTLYEELHAALTRYEALCIAVHEIKDHSPPSDLEFWTVRKGSSASLAMIRRWHGEAEGCWDAYLQISAHELAPSIVEVLGRTDETLPHPAVVHGLCRVCGHYGEECTRTPAG